MSRLFRNFTITPFRLPGWGGFVSEKSQRRADIKNFLIASPLILLGSSSQAETLVIGSGGANPGALLGDVPVGTYIRSDHPDETRSNTFLLVGELDSNRGSVRGPLSFDLSTIPTGATITTATVSLFQDKATQGSGGSSRTVNIELSAMTGAVTNSATWSNTSVLFGTLLATTTGDTTSVTLNDGFIVHLPSPDAVSPRFPSKRDARSGTRSA